MAGRYLITGVQLGMLITLLSQEDRKKLLIDIEDKQYVGRSSRSIFDDVATIAMEWKEV